ncbi:MAG: hypothetical protein R3C16_02335 [Hyphomonadaceae bacterium]
MAAAVLFLASDQSSFLNGVCMDINGGLSSPEFIEEGASAMYLGRAPLLRPSSVPGCVGSLDGARRRR